MYSNVMWATTMNVVRDIFFERDSGYQTFGVRVLRPWPTYTGV